MLFDAIKAQVDRKRVPGQYYLTGSSMFVSKVGIHESLTGRIGILHLHPLTLSEALGVKPPQPAAPQGLVSPTKSRFQISQFTAHLVRGGFPVPMFLRNDASRDEHWNGWLETTLSRDILRVFKGRYDPELAMKILRAMAESLQAGAFPDSTHIGIDSRKLRPYGSFRNHLSRAAIPLPRKGGIAIVPWTHWS